MVSVFLLHGANFLTLKLDDKLRERAAVRILYIFAATMVVVPAISTYIYTDIGIRIGINPDILPIASVVVLLVTIYFINYKLGGWASVMSGLNIILTQVAFFSLMFPRVMVSSLNPAWSLIIHNAAASPQALQRKA